MTSTRIVRERGARLEWVDIRRRWALVLGVALTFSVTSFALDALRGTTYTAETLVKVRDFGETDAGGTSKERLTELWDLAGHERLARSAMDRVGWEKGIEEYGRRLAVETGGGGEMVVEFYDSSQSLAVEGADAYARAFVSRMERMGEDRLAGGSIQAEAVLAREARILPEPVWNRPLVLGLAALPPGLLLGCALALAAGRRSRRWWEAGGAELTLGVPVLGVIPESEAREPEAKMLDAGESEETIVAR